jgi:Na+-driven multidrug efflux pump
MKDLTEESVGGHIVKMALPIAAGMFFQTLYFLIDLYFIAHLGDAALAGVGAAAAARA